MTRLDLSDSDSDYDSMGGSIPQDQISKYKCIEYEWDLYMNGCTNYPVSRKKQINILDWWELNKTKFPYLSQVARCLLGSQTSSGCVELDNGLAGLYTSKNRSSISSEMLEIKLFCNRNKEDFFDWNKLEKIDEVDIPKYMPKSFDLNSPFGHQEKSDNDDNYDDDNYDDDNFPELPF